MDLWQLNIFCKVIDLKSFSKAGKAVHLSQPTISTHIKDLEEHFGCRLIDRLGKEAVPTKAGELLAEYARRLVSLRDEMETAMTEFLGAMKGRLVIGGSTIPGNYVLPRIIGSFIQNYPDVTVSLNIGDTEEIIGDIISGMLEFGVVGAKSTDRRIVQEKLVDDEMCLIVPEDHHLAGGQKISFETLAKEPFIIRESGSGTLKSLKQSLSKIGRTVDDLNVVAEMGSTSAVIQAIKHRIGISILSLMAVDEEIKIGNLKALPVEGLDLTRSFYITTHKDRSSSPLCRAVMAHIRGE